MAFECQVCYPPLCHLHCCPRHSAPDLSTLSLPALMLPYTGFPSLSRNQLLLLGSSICPAFHELSHCSCLCVLINKPDCYPHLNQCGYNPDIVGSQVTGTVILGSWAGKLETTVVEYGFSSILPFSLGYV